MKNSIAFVFCLMCTGTLMAQEFKGAFVGNGWNLGFKRQELPFGVTVSYSHREYQIENNGEWMIAHAVLDSRLEDLPQKNIDIEHLHNKHKIQVVRLQPDVWLFPFLNVYGFAGKVYTDSRYDFAVKLPVYGKTISYKDKSVGWEYGGGVKLEYDYKGLIPQAQYSLYWTALDEYNDCQRSQEIAFNMGYRVDVDKRVLKNIVIRLGVEYNHVRLKSEFGGMFTPDEELLKNESDALLWLTLIGRVHNIDIEYWGNQVNFATEKDEQDFEELLNRIDENGFRIQDFPYFLTYLKNYSRWNMMAEIDISLTPFVAVQFHSTFMENRTTYTVGLSWRFFGKRRRAAKDFAGRFPSY